MTNTDLAQTLHINLTQQETKALEDLAAIPLDKIDPASAAFDLSTACQYYNKYKYLVPMAEKLIEKIPGYGSKIATLIKYFQMIADFACPTQTPQLHQAALASARPVLAPAGFRIQRVPLTGVLDAEQTDYSNVNLTNGYGMLAKAGASVTKGATVEMDVKFTLDSVATQDFKSWLDSQKSNYSNEEWHKLEENYAAGGFLGGLLLGAFGFLFGGGSYNHYKNQHDKQVTSSNSKQQGFLKSLHDVTTTKVCVQGKVTATGLSNIPTTAAVYAEVTQIDFKDGKTITVVNSSNPVVADESGDTKDVSGSGQLNIVPIG
ncbi:hypothetical protein [Hyphococcus sp.]|uniref:hypothetical protein n=1 Tax=Hyphococcus sp. TaxID=2038636 RepID=UPI003D126532